MHLTNYSMNRFSEGYVQADGSVEGADSGSKWTFATLRWMGASALLPVQPGSHTLDGAPQSATCTALQHCLPVATAICSSCAFSRTCLLSQHAPGCSQRCQVGCCTAGHGWSSTGSILMLSGTGLSSLWCCH